LKGHEFTRADKSIGLTPALAAEGCISQFFSELLTFSAARLAPEESFPGFTRTPEFSRSLLSHAKRTEKPGVLSPERCKSDALNHF
jgi:hypothetical protein